MPILLVSEVKGNVCSMSYLRVAELTGLLTVMELRSLCTRVRPTLSVHFTRAT